MRRDLPSIVTKDFELGPWTPYDFTLDDVVAGTSTSGPHKRFEFLPWTDPANQLGVHWSDPQHTRPLFVEDGDGCLAAVQPSMTGGVQSEKERP